MLLKSALDSYSRVLHFAPDTISSEKIKQLLKAATGTPSFADQAPLRLLVIEDVATKSTLRSICEAQRRHWFDDTPEWMQEALEHSGESSELAILTEAPLIVCVFGEIEKPDWRAAAWSAIERLRLAALGEDLQAQPIRLDSFGFMNSLLGVSQIFSGVGILAIGKPQKTVDAAPIRRELKSLVLNYETDPERLEHWNDPIRLAELERLHELQPRPFLSDKLLLLHIIQTAIDIYSCQDVDTIFSIVTKKLRRLFKYDRASIAYINPEDGKVRLRNIHKEHGLLLGENYVVPLEEDNIIGWVMINNSGSCRNNIPKENLFDEQMSTEALCSDMIVPLVAEGSVIGTLNVGSYSPNAFSQSDFEILREFGKLLGVAVDRAQSAEKCDYDALTGVLSHNRFHDQLHKESIRCTDVDMPVGLLIINLDHFRVLNTSFGYEVGDKVLASVAQIIRESIREVDIAARMSGEEFAVILPEAEPEFAVQAGEKIRAAVESKVHTMHHSRIAVKTTVSIGVAVSSASSSRYTSLIDDAQHALAQTKSTGRNRVEIFDSATHTKSKSLS